MPQDQPQTPDPVLHVIQHPQFITQADGSIRAYYPGDDWYVTASSRDDAIIALGSEVERRMSDPAYLAQHLAMAQSHAAGEVTPGFQANYTGRDDYEHRVHELGDRLTGITPPREPR